MGDLQHLALDPRWGNVDSTRFKNLECGTIEQKNFKQFKRNRKTNSKKYIQNSENNRKISFFQYSFFVFIILFLFYALL
jgi:hypothetical protein